ESQELDLALVEALPARAVFYPHLPVARRTPAAGAAALAVGHVALRGRGLWSASTTAIGPARGAIGAASWLRALAPGAWTAEVPAGTPLFDALGRVVALAADPPAAPPAPPAKAAGAPAPPATPGAGPAPAPPAPAAATAP